MATFCIAFYEPYLSPASPFGDIVKGRQSKYACFGSLCLQIRNPVIPLVELDIVLIVEPLGLGLRVDPELLGLLPEGVAVLTRVLRYLRPKMHNKRQATLHDCLPASWAMGKNKLK